MRSRSLPLGASCVRVRVRVRFRVRVSIRSRSLPLGASCVMNKRGAEMHTRQRQSTSGGARPVNVLRYRDRHCRARLLQLGLLLSACHLDRRPDLCRENKLTQISASWLSGCSSQRQTMPLAARSFGQPRPTSRLDRAGRPHRTCFPHSGRTVVVSSGAGAAC